MDKEKIILGINEVLSENLGIIMPHILEDLAETIFTKIKPDLCPKDLVNYHDVVKIVEQQRNDSPKMVVRAEDEKLEKALNKIRDGLRTLKKS